MQKKLSRQSLLILGIICEIEINPYEINRLLEVIKIREWFPIAVSTVYATIKGLEKSGLIVSRTEKLGAFPEKRLYTATNEGQNAFITSLEQILMGEDADYTSFNIASIFICHIQVDRIKELLKLRREYFEDQLSRLKEEHLRFMSYEKNQSYILISMEHNRLLFEAELKTIEILENDIKNASEWNQFLTKQLK